MNNQYTREDLEREIEKAKAEGAQQAEMLFTLRLLKEGQEDQEKRLRKVERCTTKLEVKAGVWGFLAGLLPAIGVLLWWFIRSFSKGG